MIFDDLRNADLYHGLSPRFARALIYLAGTDVASMEPNRYDIDGDDLFLMVQEYNTKPMGKGMWEAHRVYADIQLVVSGAENMGYAPLASMEAGAYDAEGDFLELHGHGLFLPMQAGQFIVLWPQDAHMPGMAIDTPTAVKKAVVKVRL